MKISVIQQRMSFGYNFRAEAPGLDILRERAESRLSECLSLLDQAASEGADLAVTTETVNAITALGDTRYKYTDLYEGLDGEAVRRFSEAARKNKMYIVAGLLLTIDGSAYNCALLFGKDGEVIGVHKKVHLPAGEELHVRAGDSFEVFPTEHGNLGMLVCWDMQYPEAARELALMGADLICCPTLGWENIYGLARAYENGVTIAAAMCAFDEVGFTLCSPSCIVDNMGSIVKAARVGATEVVTAEVDILKEPEPQYSSEIFYPSHSMRKTRFSQRRPDTYKLQGAPLSETPLYSRYFDKRGKSSK
jgi:predicted amidohydrolase